MSSIFVLMFWVALGAYVVGKKKGKGADYALLSVPLSLGLAFLMYLAAAVIQKGQPF